MKSTGSNQSNAKHRYNAVGLLMLERAHQQQHKRPHRARERRYRQRQRNGEMVVSVVINAARLDAVARIRKLTEAQCADKHAIADAIAAMIDQIEF